MRISEETEFLGHIITTDGIKPNPNKINAIINFPIPKTTNRNKIIPWTNSLDPILQIAKLMTSKLKKGAVINTKHNDYMFAFEKLKVLITSDPILIYPNFEKKFSLTTDASNIAIGDVLSQEHKPICYGSRTLNEHEPNYSAIKRNY